MKIPLPVTPFDMACHGPRRLEKIEGKWTLAVSNWKLRDLDKHEAMFVEAALAEGRAASAPAMPDLLTREQAPLQWTEDARAGYVFGWNACREAVIAASPESPHG